ncbi:hypothetical protein VB796_16865 [Arcicella sp. LKC2W]|uniref:hypothetical protein n=1 Tax=Arcicella sp. LKC2W TaxID=2984198 RepID=UPI002B1EEE84|nr:hypothetical protein [Arcicella sp. LKC2W]MEA5460732.1 hypothetical protein [Arcicella sp. LKC2W]
MIEGDINILSIKIDANISLKDILNYFSQYTNEYIYKVTSESLWNLFYDDNQGIVLGILSHNDFIFLVAYIDKVIQGQMTHEFFKKYCIVNNVNAILYTNNNTVDCSYIDIWENGSSKRFIAENYGIIDYENGEETEYEVNGKHPSQILKTYLGFPLSELNNVLYDVVILKN